MKNTMNFEDGILHSFSDDEITILKIAIRRLSNNDFAEDMQKIEALENLKSLFLEHLD